ncbi:MAG: hypothetical protein AB2A00_36645 [Myxococcota bacterium]
MFLQQPSSVVLGEAITPAPVVEIQDANGVPLQERSDAITVRLDDGSALEGTTQRNAMNGQASFDDLRPVVRGQGHVLVAEAAGLDPVSSVSFDVTGAATQLVVDSAPTLGTAGQPLPTFTVELRDDQGVRVHVAASVTLSMVRNANGAVLSGDVVRLAQGGVATFDNVVISAGGLGYRLRVSSPPLPAVDLPGVDVVGGFFPAIGEILGSVISVDTDPDVPDRLLMLTRVPGGIFQTDDRGTTWSSIANGGAEDVPLIGLARAPDDPDLLYAASADVIYRSRDRGATWSATTAAIPSPAVPMTSLLAGPGGILWVGTVSGMYASTDGGDSVSPKNVGLPANVDVLALTRADNTLIAGTNLGVYVSTDNADTWTSTLGPDVVTNPGTRAVVLAVKPDPLDAATLFAINSSDLFRYSGGTWSHVDGVSNNGLRDLAVTSGLLLVVTSGGIYVADRAQPLTFQLVRSEVRGRVVVDPHGNGELYGTGDFRPTLFSGSVAWTQLSSANLTGQVNSIAFNPAQPDLVLVGMDSAAVLRTTDRGLTWASSSGLPSPSDTHALLLAPDNRWLSGTQTRLYTSQNDGQTWSQVLSLTAEHVTVFASHPSEPATIWAGTSSTTSALWVTANAGQDWTQLGANNFSIQDLVIVQHGPTTALALTNDDTDVVRYTNDAGANWESRATGITAAECFKLARDTSATGAIYAACSDGVYVTTDNGAAWLPTALTGVEAVSLAVGSGRVWVGTGNGLLVSDDDGATFQEVDAPRATISAIGLHPQDPTVVYVASQAGIYMTLSGGL